MYVFGFQYEVSPISAGASTTPGLLLHKDHTCTRHALLTRGLWVGLHFCQDVCHSANSALIAEWHTS